MRKSLVVVVLAVVGALALPVVAAGPAVGGPASVGRQASRITEVATDVVSVFNVSALRLDVATRALDATRAAGGTGAIGRSASVPMNRVHRNGSALQQAPSGFSYPMGTTVLPRAAIRTLMGPDLLDVLSGSSIVMGRTSADLRGARTGDVLDLVASNGSIVPFTVGAVYDDAVVGGTEILMTDEAADRLGIDRLSRVVLWGFESRARLDAELSARGLVSTSIRIRRSWDPPDPDSTIGMAATKQALGEFAYRVNSGSVWLTLDSGWAGANITYGSIPASGIFRLTLGSGCHRGVRPAIEAAMQEVNQRGLQGLINYTHANTAGGCFAPRFNRLAPNSSIGFISRHAWGMAVDTNTIGSCQGCAPPDFATRSGGCDVVRIFRKHGFSWGGNYLLPDGMHFEWVGERRDQLPYPSRFCPNLPPAAAPNADGSGPQLAVEDTQRATFFADDGLVTHS